MIGIDMIEFVVNIISELVFIIILYLFLFHILLEGGYYFFSLVLFFINSLLSLF